MRCQLLAHVVMQCIASPVCAICMGSALSWCVLWLLECCCHQCWQHCAHMTVCCVCMHAQAISNSVLLTSGLMCMTVQHLCVDVYVYTPSRSGPHAANPEGC
jgi:hypothetical protein